MHETADGHLCLALEFGDVRRTVGSREKQRDRLLCSSPFVTDERADPVEQLEEDERVPTAEQSAGESDPSRPKHRAAQGGQEEKRANKPSKKFVERLNAISQTVHSETQLQTSSLKYGSLL